MMEDLELVVELAKRSRSSDT